MWFQLESIQTQVSPNYCTKVANSLMWLGNRKMLQSTGFALEMNVMDPACSPNLEILFCQERGEILQETPAVKQNSLRERKSLAVKIDFLKLHYFSRYALHEDGSALYQPQTMP